MYIELEMGMPLSSKRYTLETFTANYNKTSGGSRNVVITRNFTGNSSVRLYVSGGKAQSEEWGFGKHFDGSGTWVNDGYETNYTVVTFSGSETSKTVTLTMADNGTIEPNKAMTVYLSNPSIGGVSSAKSFITLVDNRVNYTINVLNPGSVCGHDLSAYALDNTGNTNNRVNFQALLDHFKNNHAGANLIIYFPAGSYQFRVGSEGEIIKVPTVSNRITFVGEANPINRFTDKNQPIDSLSGLSHIYMYADNSLPPSSNRWTRLFTTYKTGYIWSGSSDDYRIGLLNLVLDGKANEYNENGRPNADSLDQQKLAFFAASGSSTGKMRSVVESCHTRLSAGSGMCVTDNVDWQLYNLIGHNHFIGFFTYVPSTTGARSNLTAKKCYGSWPYKDYRWNRYDQAGFDSEPNTYCSGNILLEDCQFGAKMQLGASVASGKQANIVLRRVKVIDPASGDESDSGASIAFHQDVTAISTLLMEDCELLLNTKIRQFNNVSVYRTKFNGYAFTDWLTSTNVYNALTCNGRDDVASTLYFEDCSFNFYNFYGGALSKGIFGLVTDVDTDKNDVVRLVRPTFGSGLQGGVYSGYNLETSLGTPERIIEYPVMNISGGPSPSAAYVIYASGSPYVPQILTIKGGTYNSVPFMWAEGYVTNPLRYQTIIKFEDFMLPKDKNKLLMKTYGFKELSFMPTSAKHPSSMVRGTTTTVNCTNHGLLVNDKIMFDAIGVTEWKNALCPDANVPIFQVTEVASANSFKFNYNSSGLSADYDGGTDLYGAFYKPPVRLIIGEAGDDPVTSKPAGFAGDLYRAGSNYYRCKTSGVAGSAIWELY